MLLVRRPLSILHLDSIPSQPSTLLAVNSASMELFMDSVPPSPVDEDASSSSVSLPLPPDLDVGASVSILDVISVRHALLHRFPREIVDKILNFADYKCRIIASYEENFSTAFPERVFRRLFRRRDFSVNEEPYLMTAYIPNPPTHLHKDLLNPMKIDSVTFTTLRRTDTNGMLLPSPQFNVAIVRRCFPIGKSLVQSLFTAHDSFSGKFGYPELKVNGKKRWSLHPRTKMSAPVDPDQPYEVVTWTNCSNSDAGGALDEGECGLSKEYVEALQPGDRVSITAVTTRVGPYVGVPGTDSAKIVIEITV
ncbi:hypothetical protein HGRIS_010892 [Hohenbuehelia grisea]|uniref:F-box domain-containing protein n=1 Tax=Hohenbuehelia grisea TaxID=104357 RepID=A0ABR3IYA1_9AGAR